MFREARKRIDELVARAVARLPRRWLPHGLAGDTLMVVPLPEGVSSFQAVTVHGTVFEWRSPLDTSIVGPCLLYVVRAVSR